MSISRRQFVVRFIISGFAFLFISTSLLGTTGPRGFPHPPDSILRTGKDSPVAWKRVASSVLVPIKAVLIGPLLLPGVNFLEEDPPPPFVGLYFIAYWSVLATISYHGIGALMRRSRD